MSELYCGIDASLTGTGFIVIDENSELVKSELIITSNKASIEERIIYIVDSLAFLSNNSLLQSVCMEGLAHAAKGQAILELAALHYYIRIFLFQNKIKYTVIAPNTLKKFVSGKGQSKKNLMLLKTYIKWGKEFEDDNICDAFGLAKMALEAVS